VLGLGDNAPLAAPAVQRARFASFAYILLDVLRRIGLRHTEFASATCGTIRIKLLKIGAHWPPG
jgi:hypothetical protein